jgi:hypothetical protein
VISTQCVKPSACFRVSTNCILPYVLIIAESVRCRSLNRRAVQDNPVAKLPAYRVRLIEMSQIELLDGLRITDFTRRQVCVALAFLSIVVVDADVCRCPSCDRRARLRISCRLPLLRTRRNSKANELALGVRSHSSKRKNGECWRLVPPNDAAADPYIAWLRTRLRTIEHRWSKRWKSA